MGYRIVYDPEHKRKYPRKREKKIGVDLTVTLLLLAAIILLVTNPTVSTTLKDFLLPGDPLQTEAALRGLVEDVRSGAKLQDAITAFCLEILDGAVATQ